MAFFRGLMTLIAVLILYRCETEGKYIATGTCSEESCHYLYSATLVTVMGGSESQLHVSTDVKTVCESVGTFDELKATRYCIDLENTIISPQKRLGEDEEQNTAQTTQDLLKKPFCFIQTSDGKIVSTQHNGDELAVHMKKGIAAAFQGNFKQTAEEVEDDDTLSKHVSHYRYETPGEDHVIMYRTVDSNNKIQFDDGNENTIGVQKSEVIEYKKKVLQSSSGTMKVTATGKGQFSHQSAADQVTNEDSFGSNELSGTGKYTLKLQKCSQKASVARSSVNILELSESKLSETFQKEDNEKAQLDNDASSINPASKQKRSYYAYHRLCQKQVTFPCGAHICYRPIHYYCGVRICRGRYMYGIYYCGFHTCIKYSPYQCGVRYCSKTISYYCGYRYGYRWYPYMQITTI